MKREGLRVYSCLRRLCLVSALTAGLALTVGGSPGVAQSVDPDAIAGNAAIVSQLSPFNTTLAYVVQFYPLWFTYYQSLFPTPNRLGGPNRISPIYHYVVAINVPNFGSCLQGRRRFASQVATTAGGVNLAGSVLAG